MDRRTAVVLAMAVALSARVARAQSSAPLPPTRADSLLAEGRWMEAEAAYYRQSERAPRDPAARAALGRYIAMKGAVRPGLVLIAEARKFGLDKDVTRELVTPLSALLQWRDEAATFKRDTTLSARAPNDRHALFQVALPRTDANGRPQSAQRGLREVSWHDVVDRQIGLDSINAQDRPIGIEVFEALSPSMNVRSGEIVLHANTRSALSTTGRRYQVLRTARCVRVLVGEQRVLSLVDALRELEPNWWQLDLPHGLLVVR
ncbi:MAG: hypothetical protein ABI625_10790 [bacterium]